MTASCSANADLGYQAKLGQQCGGHLPFSRKPPRMVAFRIRAPFALSFNWRFAQPQHIVLTSCKRFMQKSLYESRNAQIAQSRTKKTSENSGRLVLGALNCISS